MIDTDRIDGLDGDGAADALVAVRDKLREAEAERLLHAAQLRTDESALTGESAPVAKAPAPAPAADSPPPLPGEPGGGFLFAGTLIVHGHGVAVVTRTGSATALGQIGASLAGLAETTARALSASSRAEVSAAVARQLSAAASVSSSRPTLRRACSAELRPRWVGSSASTRSVFPSRAAIALSPGASRTAVAKSARALR